MMSLLEGFGDWVMDEVGAQVLPDVAGIRERFDARRNQRRGTFDRLVSRLTGMDLKLEQYRRGERFVAGVAATGGRRAVAAHLERTGGPAHRARAVQSPGVGAQGGARCSSAA